jgi:anaerobic ribonucleoside-triphosphate reductase
MIDSKKVVDAYLGKKNWRVQENSNAPFGFGALNKHLSGEVSEDYWLNNVYTQDIREGFLNGFYHLHDLSGLTLYCCGYSLQQVIMKGVRGIPNVPVSRPAKHFMSILNQLTNLTTIYQNEIMGAVAFSSFDTLLAPYIKREQLNYTQVLQFMQNWLFSINSNSRAGAEPAFSNYTFDINPPKDLVDQYAMVGTTMMTFKYADCQKEMDMINSAFCELMLEGDGEGKPFAYPIPTYNVHEAFDWDNEVLDGVFEMAGKYGTPYFANFLGDDMDIADVRSMCCRLRLDLRELRKRTGGLFGSGDATGSIGVVTMNLPRMAYISKTAEDFYIILSHYMDLAKDSLEIKRSFLQEEILARNALPAFMEYVGTLDNHFSTLGLIGMNEMCLNADWIKGDLTEEASVQFCIDVLNFMRDRISEYQVETGNLYNLEATPAESTCYSLAKKDKAQFPGIITQGSTEEDCFYTNSCRLPVDKVESIDQAATLAEILQPLFTGGTVEHFYMARSISGAKAKHIVKTVLNKYKNLPYITISPLVAYCPTHGKQFAKMDEGGFTIPTCPVCGGELDMYQRITGYMRKVKFFNKGKASEFKRRKQLQM